MGGMCVCGGGEMQMASASGPARATRKPLNAGRRARGNDCGRGHVRIAHPDDRNDRGRGDISIAHPGDRNGCGRGDVTIV